MIVALYKIRALVMLIRSDVQFEIFGVVTFGHEGHLGLFLCTNGKVSGAYTSCFRVAWKPPLSHTKGVGPGTS